MIRLTPDEYKDRVLNVLLKVDQICRMAGFRYMICYGTLLGAVRHKGFIPWDDDIDIVMPREDYYKLADYIIAHPELALNYIDIYNRKDTIYYCAKVCDAETVVKEARFKTVEGYGAFVDIFPLDYMPNDEKERARYKKKALYWERIVQHSSKTSLGKGKSIIHSIQIAVSHVYAHCFSTAKIIQKMHKTFIDNDRVETDYVGVPYGTHFCTKDFAESTELEFEGHLFIAPKNYEHVLSTSYGNYMELPPENKRVQHYIECYKKD